jgi:hypothetical protein
MVSLFLQDKEVCLLFSAFTSLSYYDRIIIYSASVMLWIVGKQMHMLSV